MADTACMCAQFLEKPKAPPLLSGFAVRGFRSFHGDVQYVGPLAKVSVIAGPNNSGKSNLAQAAARLAGLIPSPTAGTRAALDVMDRPIMPEGEPEQRLTVGVARPFRRGSTALSREADVPELIGAHSAADAPP